MRLSRIITPAVAMALVLAACGDSADDNTTTDDTQTYTDTTEPNEDTSTAPDEDTSTGPDEDTSTSPDEDTSTAPDEDTSTAPDEDTSTAPDEDTTDPTDPTDTTDPTDPVEVPTTYNFANAKYTGQTHRQILMLDLKSYIAGMTADIDAGVLAPTSAEEVVDLLDYYFRFDSSSAADEMTLSITNEAGENIIKDEDGDGAITYGDISSKSLVAKIAGNDSKTDHVNWTDLTDEETGEVTPSAFRGWEGVSSPEALIGAWFAMIGDNAVKRANGEIDWPVYLTPEGHDLNQLVQKFLTVAITFSQGADDYLDGGKTDFVDGKGLNASNILEEGAEYTGLEHAWDEGFGYFGAAINYGDYTDDEIAKKGGRAEFQGYNDADGDGFISLKTEYNFGGCVNAAKRDRGSVKDGETEPTYDMTGDVFTAFVAGRHLISTAGGDLNDEQMTKLIEYRDTIVHGWEMAFAATAIHYINDTLGDMAVMGTEDYDLATHAKHWSELKGFALGFQFSPHSPLSGDKFEEFHTLVGDAPVLEDGDVAAYETALLAARDILRDAYGFDAEIAENW